MNRIATSLVAASLVVVWLVVASHAVLGPTPVGPGVPTVMAAEATDKEIEAELAKIKMMVADIEMKAKAGTMMMDSMGKEKAMKMLMDVTRTLRELQTQAP